MYMLTSSWPIRHRSAQTRPSYVMMLFEYNIHVPGLPACLACIITWTSYYNVVSFWVSHTNVHAPGPITRQRQTLPPHAIMLSEYHIHLPDQQDRASSFITWRSQYNVVSFWISHTNVHMPGPIIRQRQTQAPDGIVLADDRYIH